MKRLLILICAMALLAFGGVAVGATKGKKTTGVAYASVTHAENNNKDLFVSGDFKDSLLGHGGIVYITNVTAGQRQGEYKVKARKITIYTTKGSLTGIGAATQVFHDDGSVEVKDGTFSLTKGTGKYKGHTFKGTFAGPQNAQGLYTFTYKALYK